MKSLMSIGMNKTVPLMSFYKDSFDIKYPPRVDMPLNEESETRIK